MHHLASLYKNGYVILKDVLNKEELQVGFSCFHHENIDYSCMNTFISDIMLKK